MTVAAHLLLPGALCVSAGNTSPALAQGNQLQRFSIGAEAVIRALHDDGLSVRTEDVGMPMVLSTAVSNPTLEVVGADRLPDGRLRLRMRCRHAGECLPFSVILLRGVAAPVLLATTQAPAALAAVAKSASSVETTVPQPSPAQAVAADTPVLVQAGARLTMLLDDGHMHIHLPVIALGNASSEEALRVATPDHKKTYRATVVNATTVRGMME